MRELVVDRLPKILDLHGNVVATQKSIVPSDAGTIARISFGRPANPTNMPTSGTQKPAIMMGCSADAVEVPPPLPQASRSVTHQRATLKTGAESPTKLARDRQSE